MDILKSLAESADVVLANPPLELSKKNPGKVSRPLAPGEYTEEILLAQGFSTGEITGFRGQRIV